VVVMSVQGGHYVRRSGLTTTYQDLCSRSGSHWCFWFGGPGRYQPLPYFPQSRHDALADLVWSGAALPIPTNLRIWVGPYRAAPLPIITTAIKGLGDTEHIHHTVASRRHQGTGWAGWHRVIAVDNGGEPYTPSEVGRHGAGRCQKEKIFFIRPVGLLF
jgi:hypothetical protein